MRKSDKSRKLGKCVNAVLKTVKWFFIVFFLYVGSLFFREETIPSFVCDALVERFMPTNLVVHCDHVGFGFRRGLHIRDLRIHDRNKADAFEPMVRVDSIDIYPLSRRVFAAGVRYSRLPDSYYAPGNSERNERIDVEFPEMPDVRVVLDAPDILAVRPRRVEAVVSVRRHRIDFKAMHLDWFDDDCAKGIDGFCFIDIDRQELYGEIEGIAKQLHIRPLLVALDVPVSLPYMDGFTEVPEPVPSWCGWKVNLTNNDFDLWLRLRPTMGRYNAVPMTWATGGIHLHSYTRGTCLNYRTEVGPVESADRDGRTLRGSVTVVGTNGYNEVSVSARSTFPAADILRIGGFTGSYLPDSVVGDTDGRMTFRFPRSMTNNYEVLNGDGHIEIKNGKLLQLKLFAGFTKSLADNVPGVSYLVDQSQASADYVIENGVLRSDNIAIEGGVFSIRMSGSFDAVRNNLDFTVLAQFTRNDSMMGRYFLRPVTWPFSKLLLEFKLTGSPDDPHWERVGVIDRILDILK